jgi:4-hydroxybenzoate polyprenyltransferase
MEESTEMMNKDVLFGYLKIARFDHWIKQLFIIPGIVFAFVLIDSLDYTGLFSRVGMGILSTCLIASANYIINEWLDAKFDKYHPVKKKRRLVSVKLKTWLIITEYLFFAFMGLFIAWKAALWVFYVELCLFIMGIVYNVPPIRTKEIPYIDVLSESLNNALRLLVGWFTITQKYFPPPSIILGYWLGGAFLMAVKRFSEYRLINNSNQAGLYRKSFRYYNEKSLLLSSFFYAMSSVFFCGIFMIKYRIELLIAIPFLCGLFCIYLNMGYKPDSSAQKPEKLFHERGLMLYMILFVILVVCLLYVRIPFLEYFLQSFIDLPIVGV